MANKEEQEIIGRRTSDDDLVQNEQTNKLISSEQVKIFEQAEGLQAELSMIEKELQTEPTSDTYRKMLENALIDAKLFFINITKDGSESIEVKTTKNAILLVEFGVDPLEVVREYNKFVFPLLGRKKYQFGQHWREEKPIRELPKDKASKAKTKEVKLDA